MTGRPWTPRLQRMCRPGRDGGPVASRVRSFGSSGNGKGRHARFFEYVLRQPVNGCSCSSQVSFVIVRYSSFRSHCAPSASLPSGRPAVEPVFFSFSVAHAYRYIYLFLLGPTALANQRLELTESLTAILVCAISKTGVPPCISVRLPRQLTGRSHSLPFQQFHPGSNNARWIEMQSLAVMWVGPLSEKKHTQKN